VSTNLTRTATGSTTALPIPYGQLAPSVLLSADASRASDYAKAEKAEATRRAYATDFAIFSGWCLERGAVPLPASPITVAAFLASEAGHDVKPSTLGRRVAAIRYAHKLAGQPVPTDDELVKATIRGIRRSVGTAARKKAPATADRLIAMANTGEGLAALRDRALLLLGFAGAFRRSELVALDCEDVEETNAGLKVTIRRGKTDQEGKGATIAIVRGSISCPVAALRAWLNAARVTTGPVFRPIAKGERIQPARLTGRSVAKIIKAHAKRVGLDPVLFSGHSLRSGFLTSAALRGASIFKMMDVSRHRSVETLRGYVRDAELFRDHAGAGLL
jgi:site-specific recombinase XerD